MGMLAAVLQGASQGMNVLGQSMQRDLDRQDEQAVWEKRNRLLAEIQAENARTQRTEQAAFDDARFPVRLDQERQTMAARGEAQTAAEVARATNPELITAQDEAARRATQREIDAAVQKANDPNLTAAQRKDAALKLEDLKARAKVEGDERIRVANATRATGGGGGGGDAFEKLSPKVQAQYKAASEQFKQLNATKLKAIENQTWNPKADQYQQQIEVQIRLTQERMNALLGDGPSESDAAIRAALMGGDKKPETEQKPGAQKLEKPSGMIQRKAPPAPEPDPYNGMTFAQRRAAVLEASKAKASDPEIVQLQEQYKQALRANKRVEANNILAEIKKIERERMGAN